MNNQLKKNVNNINSNTVPEISEANNGWLLWFFAATFYFYQFIIRALPIAMNDILFVKLKLTASTVGAINTGYDQAYFLCLIPAGLIYDKFGSKRPLIFAYLVCGTGCLVMIMGNFDWRYIYLARIVMGIGSTFGFIGCLRISNYYFPANKVPLLVGLSLMSGVSGGAFSSSGIIEASFKIFGWCPVFLVLAGFAILMATITAIVAKEKVEKKKSSMLAIIKGFASKLKRVWYEIITIRLLFFGFFSYIIFSVFVVLWGKVFLKTVYNISSAQANSCISLMNFGLGIGAITASRVIKILNSYLKTLRLGMMVGVIAMLMIVYGKNYLNFASLLILCFVASAGSAFQMIIFSMLGHKSAKSLQGVSNACLNSLCTLGGASVGALVGYLIDLSGKFEINVNGICVYQADAFMYAIWLIPASLLITLSCSFGMKDYTVYNKKS